MPQFLHCTFYYYIVLTLSRQPISENVFMCALKTLGYGIHGIEVLQQYTIRSICEFLMSYRWAHVILNNKRGRIKVKLENLRRICVFFCFIQITFVWTNMQIIWNYCNGKFFFWSVFYYLRFYILRNALEINGWNSWKIRNLYTVLLSCTHIWTDFI